MRTSSFLLVEIIGNCMSPKAILYFISRFCSIGRT